MSVNAKFMATQSPSVLRAVTLLGSTLVALSSGTNYIYSAYAPQLGARLRVSHTQLNIIGLTGNTGAYISGPLWGRIVDRNGPRIPLIGAVICLPFGYLGIKKMYDDGIGQGSTISAFHFVLLVVCGFMTGLGSNAGIGAAINTTAKSFPPNYRATTTGLVLSGLGLSAFMFSVFAQTFFPGDTSAFLMILAIGTATSMLIGLLIVKPVTLPLTSLNAHSNGYNSVPTGDGVVCIGETRAMLGPEVDTDVDTDFAPLLSHEQDPYSIELNRSVTSNRETSGIVRVKEMLPDIHGKRLWLTLDFYLIFVIMGICSGTAIMYINNVGSISQALYAKTHTVYDDVEASKWQAAQVSILSLGNSAGRILAGLMSDFTHTHLRLPRAYCLCIVSSLFIISQATAISVSSVENLWIATLLLGLSYGSLFGSYPTIIIEWFGLAHFSENWGFVLFSPVFGGNLFSLMFGRNFDTHAPTQDPRPSSLMRFRSSMSRELPLEHQCFDGRACYLASLQVTLVACIVSLGLSWWAGIRDGQKVKRRNACATR